MDLAQRWLGLIFGTLSVVMLVKHGFDYGFVAPLQVILEYYHQLLIFLFGWLEPPIRTALAMLADWSGWNLEIYPHWKNQFCMLLLLVSAELRSRPSYQRKSAVTAPATILLWVGGVVISFLAGIATGLTPLITEASNLSSATLLVGGAPTVGVALFLMMRSAVDEVISDRELGGATWLGALNSGLRRTAIGEPLSLAAIGLGILFAGTQLESAKQLANPGLALFSAFLALLAAGAVAFRVLQIISAKPQNISKEQRDQLNEYVEKLRSNGLDIKPTPWWRAIFQFSEDSAWVASAVLVLIGALGFLATNAGLKLAGLG